jgi:8-oxo-dGTP diphosphatase
MITCTFENGNQNSLRHVTVGCLVMKDGKILLGKRAQGLLEAGKWCLLGGYANRDETMLETGIRETMEESGWVVRNLQLLRINDNPDRPHEDRQNVDFIYIADAVEKTGEKDWESEEVKWFPLDALPSDDQIAFDHLDSIKLYRQYLDVPFPLPIMGRITV